MITDLLRKWLKVEPTVVEKFQIVEIEKPRTFADLDDDGRKSVTSLLGHPGFQYILSRLKYEKAMLERKFKYERQATLRDVEFLQSGIYWADWLQALLDREVGKMNAKRATNPTPLEEEFLRQAKESIALVGIQES